MGCFCRAFGQRVDHSDAGCARWTHWCWLCPSYGHFWRFYRGLCDGTCPGRSGDARNPGHHFIVIPIRALDAALVAAANHYANRGRNGDHVDRGDCYADCL